MKRIAMLLVAGLAELASAQNTQSKEVANGTASATVTVNPSGNAFTVVVNARAPGQCSFSRTLSVPGTTSLPINHNCNAAGLFGDVRIAGSIQVTGFQRQGGRVSMSVTVSGSVIDRIANPNFIAGGDVDGATLGSANERFDFVVDDPQERARLAQLQADAERQAQLAAQRREAERQAQLEAQRREAERQAQLEAQRREAEQQARIEAERFEAQRLARLQAEREEAERQARLTAERQEAERREAERREAERREAERRETERLEAERRARLDTNRPESLATREARQRLQGFGTDGRRVRFATFTTQSGEGSLVAAAELAWNELDATGRVTFRFRETARDDWSVYLWDDSRNVGLQVDLHTRRVNYMAAPGASYVFLYPIIDAR